MTTRRPDILLVMADQLAPKFLPIHGHKLVRAPNLTKLADRGVVFDSAYCNSPLCSPSRAVFMTGRLPSRTGVYDNAAEFRADIPTFAHHLRLLGYRTVLSGKMHFCGPDQLHGFEERLTSDIYPADYGWTPNWERPLERPSWYHNMSSVTQAGLCVRTNQMDFDDETIFAAERRLFDFARERDRPPFLMVASLTHPHDPYAIPAKYWDLYKDSEIDMPGAPVPLDRLDPHSQRIRRVCAMDAEPITAANIRDARHAYYGSISYVDANLGRLMTTMHDCGLDRNAIVIFTSDHGEMLGERGLWYKLNFFEGGSRVPLVVSAPGRFAPRRIGESVSLVDLVATLVDVAGGDVESVDGDGSSLRPHLESGAGHDGVVGEYLAEGAVSPMVMLRRGVWKYIAAPGDPEQLFDLAADPQERDNLAQSVAPPPQLQEFRAEAERRWDFAALDAEVRESQRRRRLVDAALSRGRIKSWDFQPFRDASKQYVRNTLALDDIEAAARFPPVGRP